jgi:DNA-directed RNA polymerase subunit alpha
LRTGIGYVSNEENHELLSGTVDTIALDSIYSPVRTANFTVEPVRIKQKADSERLIVEITHFPTTRARDALEEALDIVDRHARQLLACLTTQGSVDSASEATTSNENVMSKSLENVDGVKSRWAKVLKDAGVETVADYLEHRGESVLGFGEAGRKSVDEALRDVGISVPED